MKRRVAMLFILIAFTTISCKDTGLNSYDDHMINDLLSHINESDEVFVKKDVVFDSVLTLRGERILEDSQENLKFKLFYYGDYCRGYFNLSDVDNRNLQVFGKKIDDFWAFKCVTKLNMEEAGGYIILSNREGIWSNGHVNFRKGNITLKRSNLDYNQLSN